MSMLTRVLLWWIAGLVFVMSAVYLSLDVQLRILSFGRSGTVVWTGILFAGAFAGAALWWILAGRRSAVARWIASVHAARRARYNLTVSAAAPAPGAWTYPLLFASVGIVLLTILIVDLLDRPAAIITLVPFGAVSAWAFVRGRR